MNIQSSGSGATRPLNGLPAPGLNPLDILVKSVILIIALLSTICFNKKKKKYNMIYEE